MAREVSSKILDGINDLVILAPIKNGFIHAFDNISHATRLRVVSQALNDIRATAREYEKPSPFADASERILSLLDFRVGVLDQDLFQLAPGGLVSRRYMYLIATFDGVWEPYMRLIWRPLGPLLDLLLCNCEGYVRATESSCEDYLAWVRKSQIDSAVFFTTTGITVSDQVYLRKFEVLQRAGSGDAELTALALPDPADEAAKVRASNPRRANRLALEVLGVLYRLSDFYPPLAPAYQPDTGYKAEDGLLLMAAHTILEGWDHRLLMDPAWLVVSFMSERVPEAQRAVVAQQMAAGFTQRFGAILQWFDDGPRPPQGFPDALAEVPPDRKGLQSGIVRPQGTAAQPATHGALLMFSVTHSARARAFIDGLDISLEAGGTIPADRLFRTIGFTENGLERLGMDRDLVRRMPKAFREGMAARASAMGDHWDHHPANWELPQRFGAVAGGVAARVELNEIDFVIQLRCAPAPGDDGAALTAAEVERLAAAALDSGGAVLIACEAMQSDYAAASGGKAHFRDHFGLIDGLSQPWLPDDTPGNDRDAALFGDLLCGYRSSQRDVPTHPGWAVNELQKDGSFLVVRKLRQHPARWDALVGGNDGLIGKIVGRAADGTPLVPPGPGGPNDFDYDGDAGGAQCPLGAHIRRANPRAEKFDRPPPRIVRRGMSYGPAWNGTDDGADRGLMFMAYGANIADQYETIQRWLNGGNSSGIASAASDPLTAPMPRQGDPHVYRFVENGNVVRTELREPLVDLLWGLYLFVPSRAGLDLICRDNNRPYFALKQAREQQGAALLERLEALPDAAKRAEWKRLLEDHDAKDPDEQARTPDLYSAIRWYGKGALRVDGGVGRKSAAVAETAEALLPPNTPTTIVADEDLILDVLGDHKTFGTQTQLDRLLAGCGAIYVSQYPDQQYEQDAAATNAIMSSQSPQFAYRSGYAAAWAVLEAHIKAGQLNYDLFGTRPSDRFIKLEVRREFLAPALAALCHCWFGLPDGQYTKAQHWDWRPVADRPDARALIPGDIYAISRHAFYPNPGEVVAAMAKDHGKAVYDSVRAHVTAYRQGKVPGVLAQPMFAAIADDDLLARNLLGMLVAAIPPMDGNLRGILADWLGDKSLWRHQAALRRAAKGAAQSDFAAAQSALALPIAQAMCKRPSPDLLHRQAKCAYSIPLGGADVPDLPGEAGDLLILSLVSATQRAVADPGRNVERNQEEADQRALDAIPIIFGGDRYAKAHPVHACPGRSLAMGAMTGMLAALLDSGRIEAQPAGLIVKISDWP